MEIKEESNERIRTREETKGEGGNGEHTKTPGEPVWLTGSKVVNPLKGNKNKGAK